MAVVPASMRHLPAICPFIYARPYSGAVVCWLAAATPDNSNSACMRHQTGRDSVLGTSPNVFPPCDGAVTLRPACASFP